MSGLVQDLRFALRQLRRNPGFGLMLIVITALGIGAATVMFSVFHAVLLASFPYPHPDRIVALWETNQDSQHIQVSGPDFEDWSRQGGAVFSSMAVCFSLPLGAAGGGQPEVIKTGAVGKGFFAVFGAGAELGRTFGESEHQHGAPGTVVLSDRLWRQQFGGKTNAIGRTLLLGGEDFTIIGVMPSGLDYPPDSEAWIPAEHFFDIATAGGRGSHNFPVVARLRPDISFSKASVDLGLIASRLARQYPRSNKGIGAAVVSLRQELVGQLATTLYVLLGAVILLLLLGCINIANLLFARLGGRQREMALRAALGATHWRILRQLLIESVLLAMLGGAAACILAWWGISIASFVLSNVLPTFARVVVSWPILVFALSAGLVTGILIGLAPALRSMRFDLQPALQMGSGRIVQYGGRLRSGLVISEVALSCVLLIGAGLLLRSLTKLLTVPLGFQSQHLWTATVYPPALSPAYTKPIPLVNFYDQLLQSVRHSPGVTSAALVLALPTTGDAVDGGFLFFGAPAASQSSQNREAFYQVISPDYFRTMEIPLIRGRDITAMDTRGTPWVAVVNEAFARAYFQGSDPLTATLGQHIKFLAFLDQDAAQWTEIVGIVSNSVEGKLGAAAYPTVYVPFAQEPDALVGEATVVARAPVVAIGSELRAAIRKTDATVPAQVRSMNTVLSGETTVPRLRTSLMGLFAGLALLIATVGLYGVLSCVAAARQKEVGVRIAVGATRARILRLFFWQGLRLALLGIAIGMTAALLVTRVLHGLLYGVPTTDAATYTVVIGLLLVVTGSAAIVPAWRATRLDPAAILRHE